MSVCLSTCVCVSFCQFRRPYIYFPVAVIRAERNLFGYLTPELDFLLVKHNVFNDADMKVESLC